MNQLKAAAQQCPKCTQKSFPICAPQVKWGTFTSWIPHHLPPSPGRIHTLQESPGLLPLPIVLPHESKGSQS